MPETIRGKEVAALEYCEPEVTAVGGKYIDVPPTGPNAAHVDGKLVSAKGWPGLAAFMRECLNVLGTEVTHGAVRSVAATKRKPARGSRPRANNGGDRTGLTA